MNWLKKMLGFGYQEERHGVTFELDGVEITWFEGKTLRREDIDLLAEVLK